MDSYEEEGAILVCLKSGLLLLNHFPFVRAARWTTTYTAVMVSTVSAAEDMRTSRLCSSVVTNMERAQAGSIHPAALSPEKVPGRWWWWRLRQGLSCSLVWANCVKMNGGVRGGWKRRSA